MIFVWLSAYFVLCAKFITHGSMAIMFIDTLANSVNTIHNDNELQM